MALAGVLGVLNSVVVPETAGDAVLLGSCEVESCPVNTSLCVAEVGCTHLADYNGDILLDEEVTHTLESIGEVLSVSTCES